MVLETNKETLLRENSVGFTVNTNKFLGLKLGKYPKRGKPSQKGNEKRVIEIIRDIEKIVKQLKDTAND